MIGIPLMLAGFSIMVCPAIILIGHTIYDMFNRWMFENDRLAGFFLFMMVSLFGGAFLMLLGMFLAS